MSLDAETAIAVNIPRAAELIGISKAQFHKVWINTGRIQAVDLGARGRAIIVADLRVAVARRVAEQVDTPAPARNAGAKTGATLKGKPLSPKALAARSARKRTR
jgi:hypothetical protein